MKLGIQHSMHRAFGDVYGPFEDRNAAETAISQLWPGVEADYLFFEGSVLKVRPVKPAETTPQTRIDSRASGRHCEDCHAAMVFVTVQPPTIAGGSDGSFIMPAAREELICPVCEGKRN